MERERFVGRVVEEPVARGSKSEHSAVQLVTAAGKFVLRRPGGNPFRDPVLEGLVGKQIEGLGRKKGYILYLDSWSVLP